jgi:hypothetical protein
MRLLLDENVEAWFRRAERGVAALLRGLLRLRPGLDVARVGRSLLRYAQEADISNGGHR